MKTEFDAKLEVNKEEVRRHAKESEDKVLFSVAVKMQKCAIIFNFRGDGRNLLLLLLMM